MASGAEPSGWHAVRSPHFTIYTDATPGRGREIATSLERFRSVFAQLAPKIELVSPAPTKILAFGDSRSYAPYKTVADRRGASILGQFISHSDGNYLTLDAGTRLVGSYAVIYHEYVHYFVRHNFPAVPRWFNEGLAEPYSSGGYYVDKVNHDGRRAGRQRPHYSTFATEDRLGRPVKRHLAWLKHNPPSLAEVVAADGEDVHHGGDAGSFYATSWALVHYLLSGESSQLERTADFFLGLESGEDPEEAF